ncbi:4'-phosphopantetheinyl transferase family protein [Candidatus Cardinium hertigii]|uniref:4'-phosphopantetheinyl transferase superfamily protein n=1 Tax=Candidatus Cardinium hertigii TaxID=247481 RepID=A0A3N2QB20_9BACT|nr:4'-phosphopantetheinyl transferase superfamily protein [Candidatus Cardinium hertigii]ROT47003.1 4'-phosphopantetheinyl transferase superfamily protein [Candidatus Cardinium hertigii]
MPVYSFSSLSSSSFLLIWKIEESLDRLYAQLHPLFLADFNNRSSGSSKKRIQQTLAVRWALCSLLEKLDLPIVTLSKDIAGKPILENSRLHCSFTHTPYFATVALSTAFPIGVDMEMVRPKLNIVQEKILTEEESKNANNCLEKLAIYWCAKEALYKIVGSKAWPAKHIFIEPFPLQTEGKIIANLHQKKYAMDYKKIGDDVGVLPHFLVFCEDHYL